MNFRISFWFVIIFLLVSIVALSCSPSKEEVAELYQAITDGDHVKIKTLLEQNPNLSNAKYRDHPIIHYVFCSSVPFPDQLRTVNLLLEHGTSLEGEIGRVCLGCAIMQGDAFLFELLLKHGADPMLKVKSPPHQEEITALEMAKFYDSKEIIELIEKYTKK